MTDYYKNAADIPNITDSANHCFMVNSSGIHLTAEYGVAAGGLAVTNESTNTLDIPSI